MLRVTWIRLSKFSFERIHTRSYKRYSSLSCVGFDSLRCANIRYSALKSSSNRRDSSSKRNPSLDMQISLVASCSFAVSCEPLRTITSAKCEDLRLMNAMNRTQAIIWFHHTCVKFSDKYVLS